MQAKLILKDKTEIKGLSFGSPRPVSGELVFTTGMVGYPESLTDPSYAGQILVMTYPLVGNYGVAASQSWESDKIHVSALIVSTYNDTPSHYLAQRSLAQWLKDENIPALIIKDTRFLAQKLRDEGAQMAKIVFDRDIPFVDPNVHNLVSDVSPTTVTTIGSGSKRLVLIDCGVKNNTLRALVKRDVTVIRAPWDYDPFAHKVEFDALFISNGPGDPKKAGATIATIKKALDSKTPVFGICLGNQLLCLAAGGDTYKLKFGHRGQNQPCTRAGTERCYLTTQNHGYAVGDIPTGFKPWFTNANDNTNEGIIHTRHPFMSVQFHPEAAPGPTDSEWLFDYFLAKI